MANEPDALKLEADAVRHASGESRSLAASLPRLMLESRRIAATVIHGLHGRRRSGSGENFWQYRRFLSGEPPSGIAPLDAAGTAGGAAEPDPKRAKQDVTKSPAERTQAAKAEYSGMSSRGSG